MTREGRGGGGGGGCGAGERSTREEETARDKHAREERASEKREREERARASASARAHKQTATTNQGARGAEAGGRFRSSASVAVVVVGRVGCQEVPTWALDRDHHYWGRAGPPKGAVRRGGRGWVRG